MKLASRLPDSEENGLSKAYAQFRAADGIVMAIVQMDTQKLTTDLDTGAVVPTVRIRAIEPIDGEGAMRLLELMQDAFMKRTGREELPWDDDAFTDKPRAAGLHVTLAPDVDPVDDPDDDEPDPD